MDFNTPLFLFLFLPVTLLVYLVAAPRGRIIVAGVASLLFYAWGQPVYLPLLLGLLLFTYFLAEKGNPRKLWAGVLLNVGALVFFKAAVTYWFDIPYPLGLSYVTFTALAYLVDVYRGRVEAERDLLTFTAYLLFFPRLLAGPITRYGTQRDALAHPRVPLEHFTIGIRRFILGLAKKALLADTLARIVTPAFSLATPQFTPRVAWIVLLAYTLQLYFDFSGYTDMALGLGGMMGYALPENFNAPYLARSIGDFWRRWHITLSNWFRDYVFYPLERRRLKILGQPLNILLVFLLTGLWHGLTLPFVIWGLIHGLALIFENTRPGRWLKTAPPPLQHLYALTIILLGWVFFRSPDVPFALTFLQRLAGWTGGLTPLPFGETNPLPLIEPTVWLALAVGVVFAFPVGGRVTGWVADRWRGNPWGAVMVQGVYDGVLFLLLITSIAAMVSGQFAPGIYGGF